MTDKAKKHFSSEKNQRINIAQSASYEISVIVGMLQREHKRDSSEFEILLPSMLRRIDNLNDVIMSATGADDWDVGDLRQVVFG